MHLFLQLAVILVVCRLVGRLLRPLGQAQVVGEMVAALATRGTSPVNLAPFRLSRFACSAITDNFVSSYLR